MSPTPIIRLNWSNQNHNIVYGDPNPEPGPTTEEMIANVRGAAAIREIGRQGAVALCHHIPGAGDSSTDELVTELNWLFARPADRSVSFHSDASGHQDVLPLICRPSDAAMANRIAADLANGIGFLVDPARYRTDLAWCHRLVKQPPNTGVLLEIGVHGSTAGAVYNMKGPAALWRYAEFHAAVAVQACFREWGYLKIEGRIPTSIEVPPGFSGWYGGATPPAPDPNALPAFAFGSRILYLDDDPKTPMMRGTDVLELQRAINHLVPAGTSIARVDNGKKGTTPISEDGVFGGWTEAGVLTLQRLHPPLAVDGVAGPKTIGKIKTLLA